MCWPGLPAATVVRAASKWAATCSPRLISSTDAVASQAWSKRRECQRSGRRGASTFFSSWVLQFQREWSASARCVSLSGNFNVTCASDSPDMIRAAAPVSQLSFTAGPRQVVIAAAEHHVSLCLAIYAANLSTLAGLAPPPALSPSSVISTAKVCTSSLPPPPLHRSTDVSLQCDCYPRAYASFRRSSPTSPFTYPLICRRWLSLCCLQTWVSRCCLWALLPFAY